MQEEWVTAKEAAEMLDIVPDRVALLGKQGKLIRKALDGRTYLYLLQSINEYRDQRQNRGGRASKNAELKSTSSQ